tara:strand:- start:197 stop:853 length:657 start_codon:yes stop_codon:yes gene_type:complete
MCDPFLFGAAASSAMTTTGAAALTSAGLAAGSTAGAALLSTVPGAFATIPAYSGLFGSAGAYSLGTTLGTLSNVGGFLSSMMGGQQAAANLEYQSNMANYRAQIDSNNALAATYAAEHDRQMFEDRYKRTVLAKQAPGWAISGVVGTTGTPLMVAEESFLEGMREEDAILYGGQVSSNASSQDALGQRYAASNYSAGVGPTKTASYINAGKSLLSGIA